MNTPHHMARMSAPVQHPASNSEARKRAAAYTRTLEGVLADHAPFNNGRHCICQTEEALLSVPWYRHIAGAVRDHVAAGGAL